MSGSGANPAGEEADLLAAEYVLGTLDLADRAALERDAATDPALRASIAAWERRLAPLASLSRPQAPPETLWSRIESSAWGGNAAAQEEAAPAPGPRVAPEPGAGRGALRFWQGGTAAGFALAAAIAGFAVLRPPPPLPPPAGRPQVAALLPLTQPGASVFLVETTPGGGVSVTPVGAVHVAPDHTLELWLLKSGSKVPQPIGLLPVGGVRLAPGTVLRTGISGKILVSQEPRGGSPTGLPTGPVLWGGSI